MALPKDNGVRYFSPTRIIDGDTISGRLDLGVGGVELSQSLRLAGLNCWESKTDAGVAATKHCAGLVTLGLRYVVRVLSADKYARRFDGVLYLSATRILNDLMVADGYAAPWNGAGDRPLPIWPLPMSAARGGIRPEMAPIWHDHPDSPTGYATRP